MGIVLWIVFGLIAGAIAKFIMPGDDPGGLIVTAVIGVVGAVIGGGIASALGFGEVTGFNIPSMIIAVFGAGVLLVGYRMLKKSR